MEILKQKQRIRSGLANRIWISVSEDRALTLDEFNKLFRVALNDFPWLIEAAVMILPTENLIFPEQVGIAFDVPLGNEIPEEYSEI